MPKRADESLKAYQNVSLLLPRDYQRRPLKKFTTRLLKLFTTCQKQQGQWFHTWSARTGCCYDVWGHSKPSKTDTLAHGVEPQQTELLAVRTAAAVSMLDRLGVGEIAPKVKGKIPGNVLSATKTMVILQRTSHRISSGGGSDHGRRLSKMLVYQEAQSVSATWF